MAVVVSKKQRRRRVIGGIVGSAALAVMGWFGHKAYAANSEGGDAAKEGLREFLSSHSGVENVVVTQGAPVNIHGQKTVVFAPSVQPSYVQLGAAPSPAAPAASRPVPRKNKVVRAGDSRRPTDWSGTADENATDLFESGDMAGAEEVAIRASNVGHVVNGQKVDDAETRRIVAANDADAAGYDLEKTVYENEKKREEAKGPFQKIIGIGEAATEAADTMGRLGRSIEHASEGVDDGLRTAGEVFRHFGGPRR